MPPIWPQKPSQSGMRPFSFSFSVFFWVHFLPLWPNSETSPFHHSVTRQRYHTLTHSITLSLLLYLRSFTLGHTPFFTNVFFLFFYKKHNFGLTQQFFFNSFTKSTTENVGSTKSPPSFTCPLLISYTLLGKWTACEIQISL